MAHAPMPKIVSIHTPRIGCNQSMSTLTEVLQSESVQRLFNRQNVYLQNPSSVNDDSSNEKTLINVNSDLTIGLKNEKKPELSVIPIMSLTENVQSIVNNEEDKHLLPSKHEGKSGISLLPIRREKKACGHYEPCENLVCEVSFQQFAEGDSIHPLIAVNIEDNEIDAPVTKHCESELCDALNIDHDRCRRAIIRCHRCDLSNTCDICLTILKTRKSQMNHKNCKMRIEYRHNRASRGKILRDRMRQRELQILESARTNKNDYTDPINGHDRAMESLQNNSELIVIPKAAIPIQQHPTIRITSVTGAAITSNNQKSDVYEKFSRLPIVFSSSAGNVGKNLNSENSDNSSPTKKINESTGSVTTQCNPFITITAMSSNNLMQPVAISNFLQSQSQNNTQQRNNSFLMPVRMVPIASLKTEPSLMHHTQGVPKFCLVADTPNQPQAAFVKSPKKILPAQTTSKSSNSEIVTSPKKILPAKTSKSTDIVGESENDEEIEDSEKNETKTETIIKKFKSGSRRRRKRIAMKRDTKNYECSFCFKKFSTDWYFKMHIAKHKGEIKFTCKFCKKPFMHLYNMTKHIVTMHKKDLAESEENVDEIDENIEEDKRSLNCANCNITFESKIELENHPCRIVCLLCHSRVIHGDLLLHLKAKHLMSDEKAVEEYENQKQERSIEKNRLRIKRSIETDEMRKSRDKETNDDNTERENSLPKRKRSRSSEARRRMETSHERSLVRRLTRRRNVTIVGLDNTQKNKMRIVLPGRIQKYENVPMPSLTPETNLLDTQASR